MESNPVVTDMLAFVKNHQTVQQLEPDSTTSPEPTTQQSTRSMTNSPPNSTNSPAATMTTDENAILAAQLASTVPVVDDKEERPSLSYKDLIIEAISSSPEQRLKLSEIYQVIKYLHPYYRKRSEWGWQNSIRHNLSLHDCFVKLPLKQTSASGVVGHFWTVLKDTEDKQNSSKRRSRNNNNNASPKLARCSSGKLSSSTLKGKGRQSVSSDSGVMSDESQANSPNVLLVDGTSVRKDMLNGTQLSTVSSMPQLHRPTPSYPEQQPLNRSNLLATLNSLAGTQAPMPSVSETLLNQYNDFTSSILMSSALLSRVNPNNNASVPVQANGNDSTPLVIAEPSNIEQLQRLQLFNSTLYQNNAIIQQAINQARMYEQEQHQIQSASYLINQLLALKVQLAKPATSLFLPSQLSQNGLQQQLIQLLSQQILQSNQLINNTPNTNGVENEPADPASSKNEDLDLVV